MRQDYQLGFKTTISLFYTMICKYIYYNNSDGQKRERLLSDSIKAIFISEILATKKLKFNIDLKQIFFETLDLPYLYVYLAHVDLDLRLQLQNMCIKYRDTVHHRACFVCAFSDQREEQRRNYIDHSNTAFRRVWFVCVASGWRMLWQRIHIDHNKP